MFEFCEVQILTKTFGQAVCLAPPLRIEVSMTSALSIPTRSSTRWGQWKGSARSRVFVLTKATSNFDSAVKLGDLSQRKAVLVAWLLLCGGLTKVLDPMVWRLYVYGSR